MNTDPSEFFRKLGEAQRDAGEAEAKADYYQQKTMIELAIFHNECKNPNTKPADLDMIRERIHDTLDLHLDAKASSRMIADKFTDEQAKLQGGNGG